ncbi:mandelate racemase/muconate lactonizing enzyme family protein [Microvirga puerhi]|uniref:glucarate dehydratase n=1 Tax=Microvirga puerhi TaxID=2876078 RepID=A0ABS7VJJ3_9HYPH|nr:mandelate racemase/muconate lactonizing enzyme family protein [Microvirga puerhi]MBZ6075331.1 mandelate racemase/muconate lactonizing enzyme family protein [Microvirga puerhi]
MDINAKTIVRFDYEEVIVPAHPGVINSESLNKPLHMLPVAGKRAWSVQFDELPKLILRMTLKDGTVGLAEFYRDHNWSIIENISSMLLGQSIAEMPLQDLPIALCREYDGFECAIWDAYAKSLDVPLHRLLGGAVRSHVKISAWSSHRTVSEIGPWVRQYREQGFDCIKFKCDLEDDVVAWCKEIHKHAPGMKVIFDPNQRWENAGNARPIIRDLEKIGNVLLLEDPIQRWMIQDYANLRQFSAIPIALHVSLPYVFQGQRPYEAVNAVAHGAVDGFNFNGGLAKFKAMADMAAMSGLPCWHGSEVDLGILEAMYVHQSAAAASCTWPSDIFGRMIRSHDLLKTPLIVSPPHIRLPEGPGLGIELDEEAVRRFKVSERTIR